jgi:hypothetical protein
MNLILKEWPIRLKWTSSNNIFIKHLSKTGNRSTFGSLCIHITLSKSSVLFYIHHPWFTRIHSIFVWQGMKRIGGPVRSWFVSFPVLNLYLLCQLFTFKVHSFSLPTSNVKLSENHAAILTKKGILLTVYPTHFSYYDYY